MSSCLFLMPAVFADIKENVKNRTNNGRVSDAWNRRHIQTRTFFPFSVVRSSSSVPLSCIYCLCLINSPAFVPCGFCFQLLLYFSLVFSDLPEPCLFSVLLPASNCSLDFSFIFLKLFVCLTWVGVLHFVKIPTTSERGKHWLNTQGLINQWNTSEQRKQAVKIQRQEA